MDKDNSIFSTTKTESRLKSVLIFLVILLIPLLGLSGWSIVFFDPEYAFATNEPEVNNMNVIIENEEIQQPSLSIELKDPKPLLSGISKIKLQVTNDFGTLFIEFTEEEIMENIKSGKNILRSDQISFIRTEEFIHTNYGFCSQDINLKNESAVDGKFAFSNFDQGFKSLIFDIEINLKEVSIPIQLECYGKDQPKNQIIFVHLNNLSLDASLKSGVIYEWNSKGADSYRL